MKEDGCHECCSEMCYTPLQMNADPKNLGHKNIFDPSFFFFYQIDNLDKNDILYSKFFWAKKIILDSKFCCANDIIGRINFFGAKKFLTQFFFVYNIAKFSPNPSPVEL